MWPAENKIKETEREKHGRREQFRPVACVLKADDQKTGIAVIASVISAAGITSPRVPRQAELSLPEWWP